MYGYVSTNFKDGEVEIDSGIQVLKSASESLSAAYFGSFTQLALFSHLEKRLFFELIPVIMYSDFLGFV
jgi:uncharacterized protein (DUF608 family)